MSIPMAQEACRLAQNLARNCGYAVFPCHIDKTPATLHGFKDAATDPDAIAELWRLYPGPLIGVATGQRSAIDVLDIDAKHDMALAWWQVAAPRIPPTTIYRTRSGGLHVYFRHATGVGSTVSKLARGVDTRGDAGSIVFWFAASFPCEDHSPPAPWPPWLLDCVRWRPPPPPPLLQRDSARHDKAIDSILRAISGAPEGTRNAILFWGACRLCERANAGHVGQREAQSMVLRAAIEAGLPRIEAKRTIASAWRGCP